MLFNKQKEINWEQTVELTNLKSPTGKEIKKLVQEAIIKNYYGVCVLHNGLRIAQKYKPSDLKLVTVAGFPPLRFYPLLKERRYVWTLGYYTPFEIEKIKDIIKDNIADELDIIFPFHWYNKKRIKRIQWFIRGIKKRFKKPLKVIIELGTLIKTENDIKDVCNILKKCNIDFVKTNSGLIPQPSLISLPTTLGILKKHTRLPIKASGGIRKIEDAKMLIKEFGVQRIGASSLI